MKTRLLRTLCASSLMLAGLAVSLPASANDFEAALSSETAQFTFRSDSSLIGWGGSELGFGLYYNNEDDYVGQLSLMQRRQPSRQTPLTLGVGARVYGGSIDTPDKGIFAIAIGGEIRYTFPGTMPMAVYLTAHYAPKITSFSDIDELVDTNVGFQIEVLPQTTAFIGYRSFDVELDDGSNYDMDDDRLHIGIRMQF
jgi:hypothetical protein